MGDFKLGLIVYCNGRLVIICSLKDLFKVEVYGEYGYVVMVVRFFFNGEWIVLGDVLGIVRVWVRNEDCILRFEIWVLFGLVDDLDWLFDG